MISPPFFVGADPVALAALVLSYAVIVWCYRGTIKKSALSATTVLEDAWPVFNQWQTAKGILAVAFLMILFFTDIPREISAVGIAGLLLCSRRIRTREMLGLVDWHLITLFAALFVIIHGISRHGLLGAAVAFLGSVGADIHNPLMLTGLSAVLSNLVSNVPATMLFLDFLDPADPRQWYTLAVSSTFAGNFILIGSIANLIVAEQASRFGITIRFREHAAVGVPVTMISLLLLIGWILLRAA